MIHGAQGKPREKMASKLYQPDAGAAHNVTLETIKRKYVKQGSFREWEKLNKGAVRPDFITSRNEKRASL